MAIQRRQILYGSPVTIAAAALQAWHSTPIEIAPAPGANRIIQPISMLAQYKPGTYPFTGLLGTALSFSVAVDTAHPFSTLYLAGGVSATSPMLEQSAGRILQFGLFLQVPDLSSAPYHQATSGSVNKPLLLTGSGDSSGGQIATSSKNAGGSGYAVNDTGTIDVPNNATATYRVNTVDGGGAVLTYSITNAGNGYVVATGLDTDTNGGGTGFKVNVLTINKGDGSLIVTPTYAILQLS